MLPKSEKSLWQLPEALYIVVLALCLNDKNAAKRTFTQCVSKSINLKILA
jgi:hypothetical protein